MGSSDSRWGTGSVPGVERGEYFSVSRLSGFGHGGPTRGDGRDQRIVLHLFINSLNIEMDNGLFGLMKKTL